MDIKEVKASKDKILKALENRDVPTDVSKLQKATGVKSWSTIARNALELTLEGKLKATHTTLGWTFSLPKQEGGPIEAKQ